MQELKNERAALFTEMRNLQAENFALKGEIFTIKTRVGGLEATQTEAMGIARSAAGQVD